MGSRFDTFADQVLLLIGRFLLVFVVCLYVRVGFAIATHCDTGQGFWCAGAVLYAPLGLLSGLSVTAPWVSRTVLEFSVASVVVTLVWTGTAALLRFHPPSSAMAAALGKIANSGWFLLGLFGRLIVTFTACVIGGVTLLMAPHCLDHGMCAFAILMAPLFGFLAPPDSTDAGLPAMLPGIWIAALLGTAIWTIVDARRRRRLRRRPAPK